MPPSEIVVIALCSVAMLIALVLVRSYNQYRTTHDVHGENDSVAYMTVFGVCLVCAVALIASGIIAGTWR